MEYKGKTNEKIIAFIALILSVGVQASSLSSEPAVKNQNFADFLGEKVCSSDFTRWWRVNDLFVLYK